MVDTIYAQSVKLHKKFNGKLCTALKFPLKTRKDLSLAYTPGVAESCKIIKADPFKAFELTLKGNSVAIVSDGSRVLGLGNLGADAAIPVMEGKAYLFKAQANIDAFPICVKTQQPDEIVALVRNIAPVFGGINLEDISTPKCFEIEARLQDLGIPVFHDDQHGTAIVVVAGILNSLKAAKKDIGQAKIIINGAGAAGIAIAQLIISLAKKFPKMCPKDIILCDRAGALYDGRMEDMNPWKEQVARYTNFSRRKGTLQQLIRNMDVFVGVSSPNMITGEDVEKMAPKAIVFALANPYPEIMPEVAKKAGAFVVGTARSDYPNQVNNMLAFPGVFRGALDARATVINNDMKIAAVLALVAYIKKPTAQFVLPDPLDKKAVKAVAEAVRKMAIKTGVAQKK